MKVDFKNCSFKDYEPHCEIEYLGEKYKAVEITCYFEDGHKEAVMISSTKLNDRLFESNDEYGVLKNNSEEERIDNMISFYAEDNDTIYDCLDNIFGEQIFYKED